MVRELGSVDGGILRTHGTQPEQITTRVNSFPLFIRLGGFKGDSFIADAADWEIQDKCIHGKLASAADHLAQETDAHRLGSGGQDV
jgi:hypothetical protein